MSLWSFVEQANRVGRLSKIGFQAAEAANPASAKFQPRLLIDLSRPMRQYLRINPSHQIRGITCYGWAPAYTTVEEDEGVHGNNERITAKNVREGTREMFEVVSQIARQGEDQVDAQALIQTAASAGANVPYDQPHQCSRRQLLSS